MVFTLNDDGNIDSLPLFTWNMATLAEAGVLLRLVLARHADQPETNAVEFQLTLSPAQAIELAADLQTTVRKIEAAQSSPKH
jgi:hypothetical protein